MARPDPHLPTEGRTSPECLTARSRRLPASGLTVPQLIRMARTSTSGCGSDAVRGRRALGSDPPEIPRDQLRRVLRLGRLDPGPWVRFWPSSIRLECAADFLQALLRLERHDERPAPQAPPWAFASEGTIDVVLMLGLYSDLHEPCFLMWESGRGSGTSACGQVGVPRRPRSRRTSMSPHRGFRMGLSGGSCSSGRVRGHGSTERRGGIHLR